VLHPNKREDLSAKLRASGSHAYMNVPRCSVLIARDPNDTDRTVMTIIKSQSAKEGDALTFHMAVERLQREDVVPQLYIESWDQDWTTVDPEELLQKPKGDRMEKAALAIEDWLAEGPKEARRLECLCKAEGISWNTVQKLRQDGRLNIKSTPKMVKGSRRHVWSLGDRKSW
jgi:hypothetical protein